MTAPLSAVSSARSLASGCTLIRARSFGEGSLDVPLIACQAQPDHVWRKADDPRPFSDSVSFAAPLHTSIHARVIRLFDWCRPSNVPRLVVAVYVDAIKRVAPRWCRPDVAKKRGEAVAPLLAHGDASAAVVGPHPISRMMTARLSARPGQILFGPRPSVCCLPSGGEFAIQATATFLVSGHQLRVHSLGGFAAITSTDPRRTLKRVLHGHESVEALAGDVDKWTSHFTNDYHTTRVTR